MTPDHPPPKPHHPPKEARHFRLKLIHYHKGRKRMNDVIANWLASPSNNVTGYLITWQQNGTPAGPTSPIVIPRSSASDASGYSSDFSLATGVTPSPGDVITATLVVQDATDNLNGPVQTPMPASITIPTVPVAPQPAPGFTLTLS
jgi:hypothetical protein